jgi:hypothetical protein
VIYTAVRLPKYFMSAFFKFDICWEAKESLEEYRGRCLAMLRQVTLLPDVALLNLSRKELTELHSMNYARYLALRNPKFPKIYSHLAPGDVIKVPFYKIFPREMCDEYWMPSDWDRAEVGASQTKGPIEVKVIGQHKLVVYDGHNRLKDAIAKGWELVEVRVKEMY